MNHAPTSTHDFMVAFDAEMTDIDEQHGAIMEIGVAVLSTDLMPQASLHIIVKADCSRMSIWSTENHTRPRYYEDGMSLVELCQQSTITIQEADHEVHEFLSIFQDGRDQKMSLCGNSVWRDYLFIKRDMPMTASLLHHRVIDCSGARELARRHCHVHTRPERPPAPLDVHCAMYDVLDAINFMRWHSSMLARGEVDPTTLCMLPLHAHRRIGFDAIKARATLENRTVCPIALLPGDLSYDDVVSACNTLVQETDDTQSIAWSTTSSWADTLRNANTKVSSTNVCKTKDNRKKAKSSVTSTCLDNYNHTHTHGTTHSHSGSAFGRKQWSSPASKYSQAFLRR